jgi:hypothetical protein
MRWSASVRRAVIAGTLAANRPIVVGTRRGFGIGAAPGRCAIASRAEDWRRG